MDLVDTLAKVAIDTTATRGIGKKITPETAKYLGSGTRQQPNQAGLLANVSSQTPTQPGGQIDDALVGKVLSGGGPQNKAQPGVGEILDSLHSSRQRKASGGLGKLLDKALNGQKTPKPTADQNAQAEVMLCGMINATKADGTVDMREKETILQHLGRQVTHEEFMFVRDEMAKPLDIEGFAKKVPAGLEKQVYLMSLLGVDVDSKSETQYLHQLANELNLSDETTDKIHAKLGVPKGHN